MVTNKHLKEGKMKRDKRKNKPKGVCCDENKLTCEPCKFEDSIKVDSEKE